MRTRRETLDRARRLRRDLSNPEARLWNALRGRKLDGLKFRRQHPAGPYVLDSYCAEARLDVEIDGAAHDDPDRLRADRRRDAYLRHLGIGVLRLPARTIVENMDGALQAISYAAKDRGSTS